MFEVQDLKYATLATVSRCGMVWFSEDVLSTDMIFNNFLARLRSIPLDEGEEEAQRRRKGKEDESEETASPMLQVNLGSLDFLYFTTQISNCLALFSGMVISSCNVTEMIH